MTAERTDVLLYYKPVLVNFQLKYFSSLMLT